MTTNQPSFRNNRAHALLELPESWHRPVTGHSMDSLLSFQQHWLCCKHIEGCLQLQHHTQQTMYPKSVKGLYCSKQQACIHGNMCIITSNYTSAQH
jgi:hypothetical protein